MPITKRRVGFVIGWSLVVVLLATIVSLVVFWINPPTGQTASPPGDAATRVELPVVDDLTGSWVSHNDGSVFEAIITHDDISISIISDGISALYWVGTFDIQGANDMTVVSKKKDTGQFVLSKADSKKFVLQGNKILFDFTAMGMTKTVMLDHA